MTDRPVPAPALLIGLASSSTVCAEVLFTRLLSVSTWYGLAFLVLSLAMLGLASGALSAGRARERGVPVASFVARELLRLGIGLVFATLVVCTVPLSFAPDFTSFASVLIVAGSLTVPMAAGGAVIARLLGESGIRLGRLYAVDLVAAAGGALAPLVVLGPLSVPTALLVLGCVAMGTSALVARGRHRILASTMLALGIFVVVLTHSSSRGLYVRYPKGMPLPDDSKPAFESWSSLGHVTVSPFVKVPFPMWSSGSNVKLREHSVGVGLIDGDAATMVYAYDSLDQLELLKSDATATAHVLRPSGRACVIGIGGGRDLEAALLFGHDEVVGFEINPRIVSMLDAMRSSSPISSDPRVHVVVGDGRAELARSGLSCTVLQASLVDTWAATGAGAFAHSEATVYTREAWALFLDRVAPSGILTFSRWYEPTRISETSRLVSLAVASLLDRGLKTPRDHIALVSGGAVATILVGPAPFTAADVEALKSHAQKLGIQIIAMPGMEPTDPLLASLLSTTSADALAAVGAPQNLDTSAATDDRPFFFQLISPRAWLSPSKTLADAKNQRGAFAGNIASSAVLLLTLLASLVVALVLLGPPLLRAARGAPGLPGRRAAIYFMCLGAGFMVAEIALMQRLHVVLGHPTYALIAVLAGLLVATGAGAAASERLVTTPAAVVRTAQLAGAILLFLPYGVIHPLARATSLSGMGARAAWALAVSAFVGLVLGTLFPSGLRHTDRAVATSLALALNGVAAVVGGVVCVLVSVWFGIPYAFFLAAALYGIAAVCGPTSWNAVTAT